MGPPRFERVSSAKGRLPRNLCDFSRTLGCTLVILDIWLIFSGTKAMNGFLMVLASSECKRSTTTKPR